MLTLASTPLAAPLTPRPQRALLGARPHRRDPRRLDLGRLHLAERLVPNAAGSLLDKRHPGRWEALNFGVNCACATRGGDYDIRRTGAWERILASNATDVV